MLKRNSRSDTIIKFSLVVFISLMRATKRWSLPDGFSYRIRCLIISSIFSALVKLPRPLPHSNGFRSVQTRYRPTTRPKIEFHGSVGIGLAGTDHRVGTKAVIPRYRSVRVHSKLIPSRSHRSLIFKYPTGYRSCQ